jgi:hypothetical protein
MDSTIEKQLTDILDKEQKTNVERKFLADESNRYAPNLREMLEHLEPDMQFQNCQIRAFETTRIIFIVWCMKKNIRWMSPNPYRIYCMNRQSSELTPATGIDELRYSLGFRL